MDRVTHLRSLLDQAISSPPPARGFRPDAPTVFIGAGSHWNDGYSYAGALHADSVERRLTAFAGKLGAYPLWYVPFRKDRFRYSQLPKLARRFAGLQVVDFTCDPARFNQFEQLCQSAGVKRFTFTQAMDALDLKPVYETPKDLRAKTLTHIDRFLALLDDLADEQSRVTLLSVLLHRLTLDPQFLRAVLCDEGLEYFTTRDENETLTLGDSEILCDLGAAKGEVIRKFVRVTEGKYSAIHAFEPDRGNVRALEQLKQEGVTNLTIHNVAIGSQHGATSFLETDSYSSHPVQSGGVEVRVVPLDSVVDRATFIKMDIEGAEPDAIDGAESVIRACKPQLAVCVYHYATDLLEVVSRLRRIRPDYQLKLRQHSLNLWDTVLYAS